MTAERYYVKRPSGKVFGPFDKNAIGMMLRSKKLDLDSEFSRDKEQWFGLEQVPEFAQVLAELGSPNDLPAPVGAGLPSLPRVAGSNLPSLSGPSDLPSPGRSSNYDLPSPVGMSDLPSRSSTQGNLPTPGSAGSLPIPGQVNLPSENDLFGSPMSVVEQEEDLFGGPVSAAQEEDLFGGPVSMANDDLFGGPQQEVEEEDLFGAPQAGSSNFGNVDFNQSAPAQEEDLFGGGGVEDNDLFGGSSSATLSNDLFGDANLDADEDDFLGGDQGFSFLDEGPGAAQANVDSWGDDLVSDNSPPQDDPFISNATPQHQPSQPAQLAQPAGYDAFPSSQAPQQVASAPTYTPSTMPASSGISQKAADPKTTKNPDEDKKRGMAMKIGLPIVICLVLGGLAFGLIKVFGSQEIQTITTPKTVKRMKVGLDKLNAANFADLREIINSSKKATMSPDAVGKVLVAHALVMAMHDDAGIAQNAKKLSPQVASAKSENALLGKGALDAVTSDYDTAKASLGALTAKGGDVGMFAHLFLGIAATKQVLKSKPAVSSEKVGKDDKDKKVDDKKVEDKKETKDAPKDKVADKADEKTDGKTDEKVEDKKPDTPAPTNMAEVAKNHLEAAAKVNSVIPRFWLGKLAEAQGDSKTAAKDYSASLKASEDYIPSLVAMGRLNYSSRELNKAIKQLEKVTGPLAAHAHNKDKAEAYHYIAQTAAARQQSDLAIKNYTKALEFDTSRMDTLRELANSYAKAKRYQDALNFFKTNKKLGQKDPDVMLGIGLAYKGLKQWTNGIAQLETGQKTFTEDARFPEQLGQLNMSRGTFTEAQKAFERAVEIDPSILIAHASLAKLAWIKDKDFARGEKHVRKIVDQPKKIDAKVAMKVAEFYRSADRPEIAQKWYDSAIKFDPNLWEAQSALSKLLLEQGKTKKALKLLERSRKEGIKDIQLSAYLADAYRQSKLYDRAIDEINRVIEKYPKNAEYVFIRGRIYFDRGNYETALEDFNKAYEFDTRYHEAYFYVGRTAYAQNDIKTAMKIFRHVLDYVPNNGDFRFYMGRALETQGRLTQALEEYRKVTEVDQGYGVLNPELYVRRGRLLGRLSYVSEGRKDLARALQLAPGNADALVAMGEVDFNEKQYDAAVENFTKALNKDAKRPDAQYQLGMSYIYLKRPSDGAKHLQLAIRYGHKDPDIYRTLGYLYKDLGQRGAALKAFKQFWKVVGTKKNVPRGTQREILQQIKELGG